MTDETTSPDTEELLKKWVSEQVNSAVRELMDKNLFESVMIEARPAWVFPFGLVIGMVREQGQANDFAWFITGDFPTSTVHSSVADTPRDAARHFALQWQLEAKRLEGVVAGEAIGEDSSEKSKNPLVERAESLYELTEQDALWQS